MRNGSPALYTPLFILTAFALAVVPGNARAQQAAETMEEIIVQAPLEIERQPVPRASSPTLDVEIVELKRRIDVTDLDLTKYADVQKLEQRISAVSRESCEKLYEMFPEAGTGEAEVRECTRRAVASALEQKEQVLAAAQ